MNDDPLTSVCLVLVTVCQSLVTVCGGMVLEWHGMADEAPSHRWWLSQEWLHLVGWTYLSVHTAPPPPPPTPDDIIM